MEIRNKDDAYAFFRSLIEKYPSDAAPMLIDIIVDYLLFPKGDGSDGSNPRLTGFDQQVAEIMADPGGNPTHTGRKIEAIKYVREKLGCGLREAKDYVEQRVWPASIGPQSEKALGIQSQYVKSVLDKIRVDYHC